ncbi:MULTISPECIES: SEC-C metal-binding domain-containing protein [unclassified Bradyrhizobium]|uniref:SEC-C metal-binding domain-containing protein n=1 Tax=unclassified Bradyrhizobium TaxID=2631580 RepID=UPI001FF9F964|nr:MULTISPECIES: SEC-C metal-binding domain-containing protein [unclassified Bradyrhizobium]MCK1538445.1 SEC-C domain-containing protein [Bradyrhizobium sp. 176]MCK1555062.1 SEC-C domain-containing protein [Bradyrhizobium sp. 171]
MTGITPSPVIDRRQLERIQSVHRGFLYQHLYAAACLLRAGASATATVRVETDEDVEVVGPSGRHYIQVKTRSEPLVFSDIGGALQRFDTIRQEHVAGRRHGRASFVIASNAVPGPELTRRLADPAWPSDVALHWPDTTTPIPPSLPTPWPDLEAGLAAVSASASSLPFAKLAGDTLTWKLAGCIQAAAAGLPPRVDHAFNAAELAALFEQLVVQLHDFPSPPPLYRPQADEPPLLAPDRVRIITGFSGAGKTSWVSQAALHTVGDVFYFNIGDIPSTALVGTVSRELAGHLFGGAGGTLGEVILPGATGSEILLAINRQLAAQNATATLVIDNAHRVSADDIRALTTDCDHLSFVLLCQPSPAVQEMEARLAIRAEELHGWTTDTIAAEGQSFACQGDFAIYERLRRLTGGLPLYVQNALRIAGNEYAGSVSRFCTDIEAQTHITETAQELILRRAFAEFGAADRAGLGALALSETPLSRDDMTALLKAAAGLTDAQIAAVLRRARSTGLIQFYGGDRIKVHDAVRTIARTGLDAAGDQASRRAQVALKNVLIPSIQKSWSLQKVSQLMRTYVALGEIKPLVAFATDELFHEMGMMPEITGFLEQAVTVTVTDPEERFWALDGLVFGQLKKDRNSDVAARLDAMSALVAEHNLGADEKLAVGMKKMIVAAREKRVGDVRQAMEEMARILPDSPAHRRIARYNFAHALFELGRFQDCVTAVQALIPEYFEVLGITPADIFMKNSSNIVPLLPKDRDNTDDLKHLADCMDLCAKALNGDGCDSGMLRIQAMKFYEMARAFDSHFRVGQDLVDEFIGRRDYIGARDIFERVLLPSINQLKLAARVIPIRSQYAVVLAYCGDFGAADAEMARLAPYESGLSEEGRTELQMQQRMIGRMRTIAPPPQWDPSGLPARPAPQTERKIPVNAPCPCGSGKKYKKCHGRR